MNTSEKLFSARFLIVCFTLSFLLLGVVVYDVYATEIQNEITDAILHALPDLDSSLAKL